MKNNAAIKQVVEQDRVAYATPELIVDWNMNRYVNAEAENDPVEMEEGYEVEIFPIESIIEPVRPTKGINKARVDSGTTSNDDVFENLNVNGRYYVADEADTYKYWTSPYPSGTDGLISKCKPSVIYDQNVKINKIVITTENSWATMKTFKIQVTENANPVPGDGSWYDIADQTNVDTNWKRSGQIVLYWDGMDWNNFVRSDLADGTPRMKTIRGIRLVVTELEGGYKRSNTQLSPTTYIEYNPATKNETKKFTDGKESRFDLIEISARLEADLTQHLIEVNSTMDMGSASQLYPIGNITTNQASVTLSNLYKNANGDWKTGMFSADNNTGADATPYAKFIDANAQFNLSYVYKNEDEVEVGRVQEFQMYSDLWSGQATDVVSVDLSDFSKFFNTAESKLQAALWQGLTVSQTIQRILDSVGFVNYKIERDADVETDHIIPAFYTDGEKNVWEVLQELAEASQTAIYFDSYGVLQVKTRRFAFSEVNAPVATLTSTAQGNLLENIVTLDINTEYQPNFYTINYQKTNYEDDKRGAPVMQQVWTPENDNVVLRATPLIKPLDYSEDTTFGYFFISSKDVAVWPYEGIVNIEGEIIRYEGKRFIYYTGENGATQKTLVVKNQDQFNSRNKETPVQYRHKNHFDGGLKITERGAWSSEPREHLVDINGWDVRQIINGNRQNSNLGARFVHKKDESRVMLMASPRAKDRKDFLVATRGAGDDTPYYNYGTRFRFIKQGGRTTQQGGMVIHNNGPSEAGYYFDFTPSRLLAGKKASKGRNEFVFYRRDNGKDKVLAQASVAIAENIDYELDVEISILQSSHNVRVWLNGKLISSTSVGGSDRVAANGRFGMFNRGRSLTEYEYIYAIRRPEEPSMPEDFSMLDKIERGYRGYTWDKEWVYRVRDYRKRVLKRVKKRDSQDGSLYYLRWQKAKKRYNRYNFDEFGPIVHEIREFEAKFEPSPVQFSKIYSTNDWAAVVLDYLADPFQANFTMANTSRKDIVVHGEDKTSFAGSGDAINQVLTVFGKALKIDEAQEVKAKNAKEIKRRGKIESEISNPWIQSRSMAKGLAEWLETSFSNGNENLTVEIFGNPLLEVTDVVHVDYPDKYINGDYFVTSINNGFQNGLATTLTLRKRIVNS